MTGSALQALGVALTCESSCKGKGVRGEGGGRVHPVGGQADDGKRFLGDGRCMWRCFSERRFEKGEGVWGRGGSRFTRTGPQRMTGSAL
jgi:hypothetical protein